ncbi:60S ribosomal protein l9-1 [Phtheirospermum japonicum]|uniref:60S ribosomal protein l9-1 n=1 Tax=Phtheirospermum japonicum TaxID=374723 RepID=A0A830DPE0_9LAMI|nr:60S ribosomal protein l9-1 [Phtheirospermum japonicum]
MSIDKAHLVTIIFGNAFNQIQHVSERSANGSDRFPSTEQGLDLQFPTSGGFIDDQLKIEVQIFHMKIQVQDHKCYLEMLYIIENVQSHFNRMQYGKDFLFSFLHNFMNILVFYTHLQCIYSIFNETMLKVKN